MKRFLVGAAAAALFVSAGASAQSTTTSPTGGALPSAVSPVGGVVADITGLNGNRVVSQVAASTEFVGFPPASSYPLLFATQTGYNSSIVAALGGGIASASFRVTLYDGDSQAGNFDYNQNSLLVNGVNFGNFSTVTTYQTDGLGNLVGTNPQMGFGDDLLDTGFFSLSNTAANAPSLAALYASIIANGMLEFRLNDLTPGDQFFDFTQGIDQSLLNVGSGPVVTPPTTGAVPEPATWGMMILGFGMAGAALRRRQKVAVRFAI